MSGQATCLSVTIIFCFSLKRSMNIPRDAQVSEKEQFELLDWIIIEKKYALISVTKEDLKVPERPKLKCLGFTYNGAKVFNMLPIQMRKLENPNTFKSMTKDWIWENIPLY